jgi:hypothetical protein
VLWQRPGGSGISGGHAFALRQTCPPDGGLDPNGVTARLVDITVRTHLRRHWSNPATTVMLTEAPLTIEDLPAEVDGGLVELDDGGEIPDVEVGDEGPYATARVTLAGMRIPSENPGLG